MREDSHVARKGWIRSSALLAALVIFSVLPPLGAAGPAWNPDKAALYSRKNGGAVLIISRQGMPVYEFYEKKCHLQTPWPVFSITKSLAALACLSLRNPSPEQVVQKRADGGGITLRQLLSQTSGISPGYEQLYKKNLRDVRGTAAELRSDFPPGERFVYGPSHYELLGSILGGPDAASSGTPQALTRFLGRVGIHSRGWRTDQKGQVFLSAGAVLTPEDLLKLGRFILDRGRGFGIRPVLSKGNFDTAFVGSPANPAYGMGFWLNKAAGNATPRDIEEAIGAGLTKEQWSRTSLSNSAPEDLVCMAGSGGQRVYVIPSMRTVIVRLGRPSSFRDPEFFQALFSGAAK
ncbi:MAG: serine hydrolase domain-containing protein [Terrimicrobiaceae bacterium]